MSGKKIKLKKKLLRVENVVGEKVKQTEIKSDVKFPVKVKKIWEVDADVRDIETEVIQDKVIVSGTIHKQIFFVAGEDKKVEDVYYKEGEVFEKTVEEKFTEFVDVPGAREDFEADVEVRVEYVNLEDIKKDKDDKDKHKHKEHYHDRGHHDHDDGHDDKVRDVWRQIVVLEIFVKVFEVVQMEVVVDVISKRQDIEVEKELLKVESVVGEANKQVEVVREIEFPNNRRAKKVKEVIAEVRDVEAKIIPDKVIVEGTLHKQILFVEAETNKVFETSVDEPFTVSVDILGAMEDQTVRVDVDVEFVDIDLKKGSRKEGFREAKQTAILDVFVKVTEELQLEVVVDVEGENLEVVKDLLKVQGVVGENERQVNLRDEIIFDRPVKKIVETITDVKINRRETKVIDDKVIVDGVLKKQIFYVDLCSEAVFEKSVEEDFTTFVDVPGAQKDQNFHVNVDVEYVDHEVPDFPHWICGAFKDGEYDPEDYPVTQTAVLSVFAKVTETLQMEVVVDVREEKPDQEEEEEEEESEYPIKIVIVQRGDTLWKIAKRYNTTVEAIMKLNPGIDPNNLQIGQKIRIPCTIKGAKG
ncbi:MAG TPA: hypothetical protein DEA47_05040 [Peptococcaceae bacterium]|nr:MAG: Peptidoglycan-binding LysM [Clostridia bacterium 41_269]HBT20708.1 hypothetical protein [Peptococcaceae bacterium]